MTPAAPDTGILNAKFGEQVDPDEFLRAAMAWHFNPGTGSRFWLDRRDSLEFDPLADIKTFDDLALFPNVTDELRDVAVEHLIPQGYGDKPPLLAVIESGGTTGAPKRLPLLEDFAEHMAGAEVAGHEKAGLSRTKNWLSMFPSGPHGAFEQTRRAARAWGVALFGIDMDPRWPKKQIAAGNRDEADAYTEHLIDQAATILADQNIGSLRVTPPVLARMVRRDELVELMQTKIEHIAWGGAHMDAESRYFYRTELFPGIRLTGGYGTTMALGAGGGERPGLTHDDPCVFDPRLPPYVTFAVADVDSGEKVAYGQRGQLVVHHVSKSFLLPNNGERDLATRIEPVRPQVGDSLADITPLPAFKGATVAEGVY